MMAAMIIDIESDAVSQTNLADSLIKDGANCRKEPLILDKKHVAEVLKAVRADAVPDECAVETPTYQVADDVSIALVSNDDDVATCAIRELQTVAAGDNPEVSIRRGLLIDVEPGDGADSTAEVCVGDGVAAAVVDGRRVKQAEWDVGAVVGDNRNNDG